MKFTVQSDIFRPEEGTLLDTRSLASLGASLHAGLLTWLMRTGLTQHGLVIEGLRASLKGRVVVVSPGMALLPDGSGHLVLVPQAQQVEMPRNTAVQSLLIAECTETRLAHPQTGLQSAGKQVGIRLRWVDWSTVDLAEHVPVAWLDLDASRLENDVCRLLQPDEPEAVELVRKLRAILSSRLLQEGARGQVEFQGQVQETLSARDFLYMSALQAAILELRRGPLTSIERVRILSELAFQVRTLYRSHPRLRDYVREIVAAGYVDHDHARQLKAEHPAARLYATCYAPTARARAQEEDA